MLCFYLGGVRAKLFQRLAWSFHVALSVCHGILLFLSRTSGKITIRYNVTLDHAARMQNHDYDCTVYGRC